MARIFKTPFGAQGDTEQVPEAPQGDGSVSLTQGFGYDYEREYEDPAAKDIRREVMNGLLHDITEAIGDIQLSGIAKWSADAAPYPDGAVVWHNNNAWRSAVGNNSAAPTEGENWSAVMPQNDSRLTNAREWTADTVSQSEAQAGTATNRRAWTAQRVRQAVTGWWSDIRANNLPLQSSIPQVPSANNVQEALEALASNPWINRAIGEEVWLDDSNPAVEVPPTGNSSFRFIKLTAGENGSGGYNEGVLINESISGSAPLIEATAEVNLPDSPFHGQTVRLLNTERRFVRAGEAGVVQDDQMQQITGDTQVPGGRNQPALRNSGALNYEDQQYGSSQGGEGTSGQMNYGVTFDSANSPDARVGNETRSRNIGRSVYMRIK